MTAQIDAWPDAAARLRAIDSRRSILLQAPAGSGKTTVLVQRLLSLLLTVDEVEEILAMTFTRKAAAEMRDRVVRSLRAGDTALARQVRERSAARGWNLLENPSRLRILTIDALNRWLASRLPMNAAGAAELAIADDAGALYALAAHRAVVDAEANEALAADLDLIYERLDNDRTQLERLTALMLGKRAHWLPKILNAADPASGNSAAEGELLQRINASLETLIEGALTSAAERFPAGLIAQGGRIAASAAEHRVRLAHDEDGIWNSWNDPPADAPGLGHWRALSAIAITGAAQWRQRLSAREGFPTTDPLLKADATQWITDLQAIERAQDVLRMVSELPDTKLAPSDSAVLAALTRLLVLAAGELEVVFREVQRVDYPHLAGAARQSLAEEGAPTDLALRLGDAIRHILVDEFQDTSIDQYLLLEQLTASWDKGDGRTLFVVGDPMQSIYLFRDAEVGLFLRARDRGIGGVRLEPLFLEQNFRAAPALIEWTNRTFATLFPAAEDQTSGAVRFLPAFAGSAGDPSAAVVIHRVPEDEEAHATSVADCIQEIRARAPQQTIVVLMLAKSHAEPIVRALEMRAVPCEAVDLIMLRDVAVVRDLSALARALDSPADRTAWLAILRAPWCGLTLTDLTQLLADFPPDALIFDALQEAVRIDALMPDAQARVARFLAALRPVVALGARVRLIERVESAWLRLGGPSCIPARELAAAESFFVTVGAWAATPEWEGPLSLDTRLARLHAPQRPVAGAVQFMTVHRAKGLEFDHVIVPFLDRPGRRDPSPLLRWVELPGPRGEPCLLVAPRPNVSGKKTDRLNQYMKRLVAARETHERVRLMYVAATRARTGLHWFAGIADQAEPRPSSALRTLWPAFRDDLLSQPQPAEPIEDAQDTEAIYYRLRSDTVFPAVPADAPWEGLRVASYEPGARREDAVDSLARVHLLRQGGQADSAHIALQLRRGGAALDEIDALAEEATRAIEAAAAHPLVGPWCFDPELERESFLELTGFVDQQLVSTRIDLRVRDAEGTYWIVRIAGGAPASDLDLAQQRELDQWRRLATAAFGVAHRGAIYYPRAESLLLT